VCVCVGDNGVNVQAGSCQQIAVLSRKARSASSIATSVHHSASIPTAAASPAPAPSRSKHPHPQQQQQLPTTSAAMATSSTRQPPLSGAAVSTSSRSLLLRSGQVLAGTVLPRLSYRLSLRGGRAWPRCSSPEAAAARPSPCGWCSGGDGGGGSVESGAA
jgi:hypothetical protein